MWCWQMSSPAEKASGEFKLVGWGQGKRHQEAELRPAAPLTRGKCTLPHSDCLCFISFPLWNKHCKGTQTKHHSVKLTAVGHRVANTDWSDSCTFPPFPSLETLFTSSRIAFSYHLGIDADLWRLLLSHGGLATLLEQQILSHPKLSSALHKGGGKTPQCWDGFYHPILGGDHISEWSLYLF